jgi:DNA repair protein RadC
MEIEGIGEVKATQIAALFELTKRIIRNVETT